MNADPLMIFVLSTYCAIISGVAVFLLIKFLDHEKRIQKVEDIQGSKLDSVIVSIKENKATQDEWNKKIEAKIEGIISMIHKEKNQEQVMNTTLTLLLKELEKRNGDIQ